MSVSVTRWWWVRHAPIASPHKGLINGQMDVDVELGDSSKFQGLAQTLPKGAQWVTSALLRTRKTAETIFAAGHPEHPLSAEAGLNEQNFGDWTGRTWADIDADAAADARTFWQDPGHSAPPGGESFADQVNRVAEVMMRLSAEVGEGDIVAVAHAGTIRAALAVALDVDPNVAMAFRIDTLSITRTDHIAGHKTGWRGGAWAVERVNHCPEVTS